MPRVIVVGIFGLLVLGLMFLILYTLWKVWGWWVVGGIVALKGGVLLLKATS